MELIQAATGLLYDAQGAVIPSTIGKAAAVPDLDPLFFQSPFQLQSQIQDQTRKIIEQPYKYYSWVYAAVSAIAINIRRLTPYLYKEDDELKPIKKHDVLKLFKKPNPFMNGSEFIEAIVLNLLLPTARTPGGQCFLIPGNDKLNGFSFFKGNIPDSIYPFSDTYVFPKVVGGRLIGWELRIPEQPVLTYEVDQIIRLKLQNPYNMLQGLSPYTAATYSIENDAKAMSLANRFSDNNANVGGILTTDKSMTKDQADDLQKRWNQKYAGVDKAGKTAVLYNGLKFEQTSKTLLDVAYVEQRKLNREEVLAVYRIPKYAVSLYEDINYATSLAAKRTFWEETLIPYIDVIFDGLNSDWFGNLDGRNLQGYVDLSNVSALKDDYTGKIANAKAMIQDGIPLAEAYRLNDIPLNVKQPWMDQPLVMGSRTNLLTGEIIGQSSMFGDLSDDSEDEDDKKEDDKEEKPDDEKDDTEDDDKEKNVKFIERVSKIVLKTDERTKFWFKYVEKTLNPGEKRFNSMMKRYFIDQRNAMQDLVDEWIRNNPDVKSFTMNRAFSVADLIPDKALEDKKLKEKAGPLYDAVIELQAAKMEDEIGDFVNWTEQNPAVEKFKKLRTKQLLKINTNTFQKAREEISKTVNDGIAAGLTVDEIAKNVKAIEKTIYDVRINNSLTIARTETASIASSTRFSIMDSEGINLHEWVSAKDEAVRHSHNEEDGHVCEVGEEFPSTGLLYPCYPGGEPEEVINCRCVTIAKKSK